MSNEKGLPQEARMIDQWGKFIDTCNYTASLGYAIWKLSNMQWIQFICSGYSQAKCWTVEMGLGSVFLLQKMQHFWGQSKMYATVYSSNRWKLIFSPTETCISCKWLQLYMFPFGMVPLNHLFYLKKKLAVQLSCWQWNRTLLKNRTLRCFTFFETCSASGTAGGINYSVIIFLIMRGR